MTDLANLAQKVRNDGFRHAALQNAIKWLEEIGVAAPDHEFTIDVRTKLGSGCAGYDNAMTEIARTLGLRINAAVAETLELARFEIAELDERYADLLARTETAP